MARKLLALAAVALLAAGCGSAAHPSASNRLFLTKTRLKVARIGSLQQAISKASAVALPGGKLMILGGYTGSTSVDTIAAGLPNNLRVVGHLPQPTHDAAAVLLGSSVYLFGGGSSVSTPSVVRVSLAGNAAEAPALDEPLSDLGAVTLGGRAYLVGGYTGTQFATAILRYDPAGGTKVVARLPQGLRYAGVAAAGHAIFVAGGLTTSGPSRVVYAVSPGGKPKKVASLPKPEDHAALAVLGDTLFLIGGRQVIAIGLRTDVITVAARLPERLTDPSVATVGNRIIVAGGGTNGVWALTP
ncbi:MAG: Kelch repeat-containing protein [Gaiellaceae bacterium]